MLSQTNLIAPCGMNCGICYAFLRDKNKCPGCRKYNAEEPITIAGCKIRNCEELKFEYCNQCQHFPCDKIKHMDKRYRTKYDMSIIENLENIKSFGIKKFIQNEKIKWACSCGGTICVHKKKCLICK